MHRFRRWFIALAVVLSLVATGTGAALAQTEPPPPDTSEEFDDTWFDDGFDDEWFDDGFDDEWFDDGFDDEWFDDGFDDEWFDDGFDDEWFDDDPAADDILTLIDALDGCLDDSAGGLMCVFDAIDQLFWSMLPDEGGSDDGWFDDSFDDEWLDDDFGAPPFGDDWFEDDFGGPPFGDEWSGDGWFGDELESVDDPAVEAEIEARFEELIPEEWRQRITEISLETDGRDGVVAAVEPLTDDLSEWAMYVDPADRDFELDHTLVHEFAHVMTLNETQLDAQLVYSDQAYEEAAAACPTYFTGEGCAKTTSYIAQFVDMYWDPIMDEFQRIESMQDDRAWEEAMFDFYDRNADQFVSDYAATNPAEDISESFAAYVMAPELPDGDTVAEQKVLFFDQFPELAQLRDSIRAAL